MKRLDSTVLRKESRKNWLWFLILLLALIISFAILSYFVPYTIDDWAWGGRIGAKRWARRFAGYNGRYVSNLITIVLCRHKGLDILVMTVCNTLLCLAPCIYCRKLDYRYVLTTGLFVWTLPRELFGYTVGWTSGYTNFVLSTVSVAAFMILLRFSLEEGRDGRRLSAWWGMLTLPGAFISALLIENVSLCLALASSAAVVFILVRQRRFHIPMAGCAVGSAAGCVLMFSNSAYRSLFGGAGYKSIDMGAGLITDCLRALSKAVHFMLMCNWFTAVILILSVVMLSVRSVRLGCGAVKRKTAIFIPAAQTVLALILLVKGSSMGIWVTWDFEKNPALRHIMFYAFLGVLFLLLTIAGIWLMTEGAWERFLLIAPMAAAVLLIGAVLPTGPANVAQRVLFSPAYLMVLTAAGALHCAGTCMAPAVRRLASLVMLLLLILFSVWRLVIYHEIHETDALRSRCIQVQLKKGQEEIFYSDLPHGIWLCRGKSTADVYRPKAFKQFYRIPKKFTVTEVSVEEMLEHSR